jgi:hypothetical protein
MSVYLSPFAGAGWQFFNDNGDPLSGGLIYTYQAGTTTPVTSYTTVSGLFANSNPIQLDSVGRLPNEVWLSQGTSYKFVLKTSGGITIGTYDDISGINDFSSILAQLAAPSGSSLIGFIQAGAGAVATNLQVKSRQWISVFDFMTSAQIADVQANTALVDVSAAISAAIIAAGQKSLILYPEGTYKISSTINLLTEQVHLGQNATLKADSNVTIFSRTTDGFPGRIQFNSLRFEGTSNTGIAISITNNTPFVEIQNCYIEEFSTGVILSGSYCSNFFNTYFSYNLFGCKLLNECHSTQLLNCFFDGNTYAGLCVNGDPVNGSLGVDVHNITSIGCAYQNSEFGVWVESCYEFAAYSTYHEGNSKADMRLGVADAGVYARFCYSFTIDSWQSSSPCANGKNIIMEHAVGGSLRGLAFNSGCSTTLTLLEVDGFSDKISIDYHRFTTVTPTTTAPFNFVGNAASRVAVFNDGRALYPKGMTSAIRFGTLAAQPEGVYSGSVPSSGRPALYLESVGTDQDMVVKVTDIERHLDASNTLGFAVDHINNQVISGYQLRPSADNTVSLGASDARWTEVFAANGTINTSDEREKDLIEEIPQAWLDAWADVNYARFKFKEAIEKKGNGARWHIGLVAQKVQQAFANHGINAFEIGLLCYDEWDDQFEDVLAEQEITDAEGSKVKALVKTGERIQTQKVGNRYGVRYEQALALECAYLRSKLNA